MEVLPRIIGRFTGKEKGPLLICLGGIHGNEEAGIKALEIVFNMLEFEPTFNPAFVFHGRIIGIRGNLKALQQKCRFIHKDLNRNWTKDNIKRIRSTPRNLMEAEELEILELLELIEQEIISYNPQKIYLLDLHTTTASGGIFSVASDDEESIKIAVELHAPVILGMLERLEGTVLHFFNGKNLGIPTIAVAFEAGQHEDPLSVNRSIAAIINCMRTIKCVRADDVENRHDELLIEYSRGLPKVADLIMVHQVQPDDEFEMLPGFKNFQPVKKGDLLALDKNGPIRAEADALILMPLYQKQGNDGFFLVKKH